MFSLYNNEWENEKPLLETFCTVSLEFYSVPLKRAHLKKKYLQLLIEFVSIDSVLLEVIQGLLR